MRSPLFIRVTSAWITFCAACNVAGWTLSSAQWLTRGAYSLFLIASFATAAFVIWRSKDSISPEFTKLKNRFGFNRPFALAFLALALLTIAGGIAYAPTNYDGLAYRTPRVLHWLAAHRWHWIHTEFQRLNARGTGFEWVCAPFISVFRTDRFLFLLNTVSFLLLPGLAFSVFSRFGVRRRLAYYWMWVLPTGYCFLLQAGSIGNDLFAVPFVLSAIDFAYRSKEKQRLDFAWLSILSAALFTSAKANTLPLVLVWLVAIFPCLKLLLRSPIITTVVCLISLLASFFPSAWMNQKYSGDWTGAVAEDLPITRANTLVRFTGNLGVVAVHTVLPPIFPPARTWNDRIAPRLVTDSFQNHLLKNFMIGGSLFTVNELENEESAALGLGVFAFLLLFLFSSSLARNAAKALTLREWLTIGAILIAFLAFMRASFVKSTARLLTPYYPLMLMMLLRFKKSSTPGRAATWIVGIPALFLATLLLVLNPARPLWPAKTVIAKLKSKAGGRLLDRAETVYSVYSERANAFDPALKLLPNNVTVLGIVTFDDPETALWRPFGSRRIVHVCSDDTPESIRNQGVKYIWVNDEKFNMLFHVKFEDWLVRMNADRLQTIPLHLRAGQGPVNWHLIRLR